MRYAAGEVVREVVVEHRVGRTPGDERGHLDTTSRLGHCRNGRCRRMCRGEWHIGNELGDGAAHASAPIGGTQGLACSTIEFASRQRDGAVDEDARTVPHEVGDGPRCGKPDEPRGAAPGRHCDARIAQHHTHQPRVGGCPGGRTRTRRRSPTQRYRAAPVLTHRDDGRANVQRVDEPTEIVDPIGIGAGARAL